MAVKHLISKIDTLLEKDNKYLGELFSDNGEAIRLELQRLKAGGDIYIGSEGCNNFDPKKGCMCNQ